jgi:HEAT repeat protein
LLLHENHEISSRAAEALGKFPVSTLQPLLDTIFAAADATARTQAAVLLGNLQNGNGVDLLGILTADNDPAVRCAALKAAGNRQMKAALPLLHHALSDPETTVREAAVMALAEFGEPNFTEDLLAMLNNDEQQLVYAVVKAFGAMGATGAGFALMDYLEREKIPRNLEYAIIETLGKINCTAASKNISAKYLQHPDPDIRRLAVETLGKLGDQHSLKGVESAAQDPHWSVRVAALHVLGAIGGVRELPLLLAAMEDKDYLVRKNAIIVLGSVRDISTIPPLAHQLLDMEMSRFAFEALLQYGRMALPWLHRLMTKNFPLELRVRVIDLIGKIADRKSVDPLLGLLDEASADIRLAAIDALTFCYDSMPLKRLASIQKNDASEEVKERAALALKTFMMEKYF